MDDRVSARAKLPSRACESCRAAKIRCQPSDQAGICKGKWTVLNSKEGYGESTYAVIRCCDFKKECIFRARPRTRRPRAAEGETPLPPPSGPSQTFSIDFNLPVEAELGSSFDDLLEKHDQFVEDLVPSAAEDGFDNDSTMLSASSSGGGATFSSISSPGSSMGASSSISLTTLGIKPQFNLNSAQKLLDGFQDMLSFCPLVALPEGANVKSMASQSPFILLAILAATSCSSSLQGFNLYDDEFRKVLGLKFVTSGERSLELLQGLLVYNAWYPYHLRPNDRRTFQYLRMAVDIVHDLGLDDEATFAAQLESDVGPEDLERLRTFISCFYLVSVGLRSWGKPSTLPHSSWIATCCDLLEKWSNSQQDHVLIWLCRLQSIADGMGELRAGYSRDTNGQNNHQNNLVHRGLEAQLREWQARMPDNVSAMPTVKMASLSADMQVAACPLMTPHRPKAERAGGMPLDPVKLMGAAHTWCAFLDLVVALTPSELDRFSAVEWGHLIVAVILVLKLAFPVDTCPLFDAAHARNTLQFGAYLEKLCADPPPENDVDKPRTATGRGAARGKSRNGSQDTMTTSKNNGNAERSGNNITAAFRIILRKVKAKFDRRVAAAEAKVAAEETRAMRGCPFFDGSLTDYIPLWEGQTSIGNYSSLSGSSSSSSQLQLDGNGNIIGMLGMDGTAVQQPSSFRLDTPVFHDLWATMTQGWAADDSLPNLTMDTNDAEDFGHF
ncbi:hypothetical protein PG997_011169 [Apiospora hydei]|uniref:Zn(2)-C6 fungal-type domain-containing protein n=1 Tax=Apiospora hydei TaxID=1337664 RepID=A0ABR1VIA6_9PEZI